MEGLPGPLRAEMFRSGIDPREISLVREGAGTQYADRVTATREGEVLLFEGDIELAGASREKRLFDVLGISIAEGRGKWPAGVVPYFTQPGLADRVGAAVAHWKAMTPLTFPKASSEASYLSFEDRGVCRSRIGRAVGGQVVSLSNACSVGDIIHEIGHAIGLWHEQSRTDRDDHVRVHLDRVPPGDRFNFAKHDGSAVHRGEYDVRSIMHYPSTAFSATGEPTITLLDGSPIEPATGLSPGDVAAVRELYAELDW